MCVCVCVCKRFCLCSMPRAVGAETGFYAHAAATFPVLFLNHLSICTMPSYDFGLWMCECVHLNMRLCSMPRPVPAETCCLVTSSVLKDEVDGRIGFFSGTNGI